MSEFNPYGKIIDTMRKNNPEIGFFPLSKECGFDRLYHNNSNRIFKCHAWTIGGDDDGVELSEKPLEVGFSKWNGEHDGQSLDGIFRVPSIVFKEMGYKTGEIIDELTIFLEQNSTGNLNLYLAKPQTRQTSKKSMQILETLWEEWVDDDF